MSGRSSEHGVWTAVLALLLSVTLASCTRSQRFATASQRTFASPEEAGTALESAAKAADRNGLVAIFGPNSKAVLFTGDAGTDRDRLTNFVTAYDQMHRWVAIKAGGKVLMVGADNRAFPIPLGRNASGRWRFDTAAGKDEILARRIGKNELTAMDATEALAGAEQQYHQSTHGDKVKQYAQKFVSDPGQQNGLYWPVAEGKPASPAGRLGDFTKVLASANAGADPEFNGYRYRILDSGNSPNGVQDYIVDGRMTRGFAILAYPTEYKKSGITSVLIGQDGTLYQKDLGDNTLARAESSTEYNPADGWTPALTSSNTASRAQQ
jgi:hypothetical protein